MESLGHTVKEITPADLTKPQAKQLNRLNAIYKTEATLIKDETTGEVHIYCNTQKSQNGKRSELLALECIVGDSDEILTYRYHKEGKIALDHEFSDHNNDYSELIQRPKTYNTTSKKIMTPIPIRIKVADTVFKGANYFQKKDIEEFLKTLSFKKSSLMKDLNIDNDEYNRLAKLAMCIAMQETDMGKCLSYKYYDNLSLVIGAKDTVAVVNSGMKKMGKPTGPTATSKGLTQIKIGDWDDDSKVEKLFKKYDITRGYYNSLTPKQAAVATIIVLNEVAKEAKQQQYQDGAEAARGKFYYSNSYLKDGKRVDTPINLYNEITEEDIMLYIYNGASGRVKNGKMTPKTRIYTHNIKRYERLFEIIEKPETREEAEKKAITVSTKKTAPIQKDLSWGIGHVAFMPSLYKGGISGNSDEDIESLKKTLLAKNIDVQQINKLIYKLKNNQLSFAYGLSKNELNSIQESDVKLLNEYSDKLIQELNGISNVTAKRKAAIKIEREFKFQYLSSHAKRVDYSKVKKSTVKLNDPTKANIKATPTGGYKTGAQTRCQNYLNALRKDNPPDGGLYLYDNRKRAGLYTGFDVEKDQGINYNNASGIDICLAQNATDTANTLRTSGSCLTGTKQTLIGSGAVDAEEMTTFNEAKQLADFLARNPERFTEIKYVQVSNNVAREITAGDIPLLPAGCIVVYGNKNIPGHAGTTKGNGQIASDEFDNSYWDNFAAKSEKQNGKGEHGYVRVFVLNKDYFKLDSSGKKLVKK